MIDLNKEYRTQEGNKVKLAGVNRDAVDGYQLIGWIYTNNNWVICDWNLNGFHLREGNSLNDLVEIPKPKAGELWKNGNGFLIFINGENNDNHLKCRYADGDWHYLTSRDTTNWTKVYPKE